jgi:hypothetical protein
MAEAPRIPLAQTISTRDSTMNYDAIMYNYYPSKNTNGQTICERRFGYQVAASLTAGAALGFFAFGTHLLAIIGTTFYSDQVSKGTVDGTSPYQFTLTGFGGTAVFLKNNTHAYTWDGTTLTAITDANYPAVTMPGVAYIDGYVAVQDPTGRIWNSNLNTPATWNALNFIIGSSFADPGAAISRLYAYVVSFGTYSCSFFYDAGNTPPGSPFLPNQAAQAAVGCAIGTSVVATENTIFWIGQTHQKGRRVYMLNGLVPQAVSDEFVDKVLNADPLTGVYAYYIEINGHAFYIITLIASNVTLAYDSTTGTWARWSSTALGTQLTVVGASLSNGILTLTIPGHELSNGVVVLVTSPNSSSNYLGTVVPTIVDANTISYSVTSLVTGGINTNTIDTFTINDESIRFGGGVGLGQLYVTPYIQNAFNPAFYAYANNLDYLLDRSSGSIYGMQQGISNDAGNFIYGLMRTNAGDFGSNKTKFFPTIDLIADKVSDIAYVGYSDDDYQTYRAFRPVNLEAKRSMLKRGAAARRRAFAVLYIGGFQVRFYNIELRDMIEGPQ